MPARVDFIRVTSDKCVGIVAGKIAGGQLRGACNPVARRCDEHGLPQVADISEHLHLKQKQNENIYAQWNIGRNTR